MATFRIKAPDGRTYRVNAPEGTTQAQAIAFVQKNHPAPKKRTGLQTAGDFAGDVIDNVLPNWGDEVYGAANWVGNKVGLNNSKTPYEDGKKYFKRTQAQYDKEHPNLAWGSTIAGNVAGVALPASRVANVANGANRLRVAGRAAAVGAGYGAAAGAGEGEGTQRIANAGKGAIIGGAAGAAMPSVVNGAVGLGRRARMFVPGVDAAANAVENGIRRVRGLPQAPPSARAHAQADRMIADRAGQGNIVHGPGQPGPASSPQAIADEVSRRNQMGVPAMPADTTEAMRGLTGWASRGQGPGQTAVREALTRRKATEGARVRQHVIDTMGPAVDPIHAVERNLAASKAAARPLYDQAYTQPLNVTPEIEAIMRRPSYQRGVEQARENIREAGGTFDLRSGQTVEGLDQTIRAMQGDARGIAARAGGVNPLTGAVNHTTDSVHVNNSAMDLRRELMAQNEPYRQAVEGYADEAAHRQAMTSGGNVANQTGHEINALSRALPNDAHPSYAQGARTALADQASTYGAQFPNGNTARAVSKSLGDDTKQAALEAIDGSRGAVPALQQRLEAENQGNIVFNDVLGNSKTADRQALDAQVDDEVLSRLSSFSPAGVASSAINYLAERASSPYRNAIKERIAQVVTETNPANVAELMQQVARRAELDADFARLLQQSGLVGAAEYGVNIQHDETVEE